MIRSAMGAPNHSDDHKNDQGQDQIHKDDQVTFVLWLSGPVITQQSTRTFFASASASPRSFESTLFQHQHGIGQWTSFSASPLDTTLAPASVQHRLTLFSNKPDQLCKSCNITATASGSPRVQFQEPGHANVDRHGRPLVQLVQPPPQGGNGRIWLLIKMLISKLMLTSTLMTLVMGNMTN